MVLTKAVLRPGRPVERCDRWGARRSERLTPGGSAIRPVQELTCELVVDDPPDGGGTAVRSCNRRQALTSNARRRYPAAGRQGCDSLRRGRLSRGWGLLVGSMPRRVSAGVYARGPIRRGVFVDIGMSQWVNYICVRPPVTKWRERVLGGGRRLTSYHSFR
jgi:hypothetical protein